VFGHDNHFVMGMSVDHGLPVFATSELGTIDQNLFVTGTGATLTSPAPSEAARLRRRWHLSGRATALPVDDRRYVQNISGAASGNPGGRLMRSSTDV
jgi:hypothetical protein